MSRHLSFCVQTEVTSRPAPTRKLSRTSFQNGRFRAYFAQACPHLIAGSEATAISNDHLLCFLDIFSLTLKHIFVSPFPQLPNDSQVHPHCLQLTSLHSSSYKSLPELLTGLSELHSHLTLSRVHHIPIFPIWLSDQCSNNARQNASIYLQSTTKSASAGQ